MSNTPNQNFTTAEDVIDHLFGLLCKARKYRNDDFIRGYETALNDMMYRLLEASPECDRRTVRGVIISAMSNISNHRLTTVRDVLDYLFYKLEDLRTLSLEGDFQRGYEEAFNTVMYQVWTASPKSVRGLYPLTDKHSDRALVPQGRRRCSIA